MKKIILVFLLGSSISVSFASFDVNLRLGSRGEEVNKVQQFLGVTQSGYFDNKTLKQVKNFQTKNNLPTTGYWGNGTRLLANKLSPSSQNKNTIISNQISPSTSILSNNETVKSTTTKTCLSGAIVSINDNCTRVCPDGETILENLTCRVATLPTNTEQPSYVQSQSQLIFNETIISRDKQNKYNAILGQINDLQQQILKIKSDYSKEFTSHPFVSAIVIQNDLLPAANAKIDLINAQISILRSQAQMYLP